MESSRKRDAAKAKAGAPRARHDGARGSLHKSLSTDLLTDEPESEPPTDDEDEEMGRASSATQKSNATSSSSRSHYRSKHSHSDEPTAVGSESNKLKSSRSHHNSKSKDKSKSHSGESLADVVFEAQDEGIRQKEEPDDGAGEETPILGGDDGKDGDTIPTRNSAAAEPPSGRRNRKQRKGIVVQKLAAKKALAGDGTTARPKSIKVKDMVSTTIAKLGASRFEKWKNDELILLLVQSGVEVRNESGQAHSSLVFMADEYFGSKDMPDKPTPYSQYNLDRLDPAVRKIQAIFIERQFKERKEAERETMFARPADGDAHSYANLDIMDVLASEEGGSELDEDYDAESGNDGNKWWFANPIKAKLNNKEYKKQSTRDIEMGTRASEFARESNYDFADGDLIDPDDKDRMRRRARGKSRAVQILDIPWHPPSWSKAKEFMNYNRPRQGGKGGKKFHFRSTTTGRHCSLGGCGEVCDIFREGQTSEFGIYGPGVTNYFKFTKWLFWLFFVLSILAVPELMLNFLGPLKSNSGIADLYATTVGNLAPKTLNDTISISVPLCPWAKAASTSLFTQDFNCLVSRDTLGIFYSGFDILICLTVLIAFAWIRYFEKQEEVQLDRSTVFASMYTLQVKNLPPGCNEASLRNHIRRLLNNKNCVVAVHIAVDNQVEYNLCLERGRHIKERTRLINRHRYETTRIRQHCAASVIDAAARISEGEARIKKLRKIFIRECMEVDKQLKACEVALRNEESAVHVPICAFVTFDSVHHLEKCLHAFSANSCWTCYKPNEAAMLDGQELRMVRAPEPSTIIWENLRYNLKQRMGRRNLTTALALLLILISVVCTYVAKILQDRNQVTSGSALCPGGFSSQSRAQQQAAVRTDPQILHCYCDTLSYAQQSTDQDCRGLWRQSINTQIVTYFASVIVLIVNIVMEFTMQRFSNIEKHQSEDTQGRSVLMRLFALKYINTSCVFLVNANVPTIAGITSQNRASVEFSKDWYKSVGVSILLVQVGNIVLSHAKKFYDYFMYKRAIRKAKMDEANKDVSVLTQDELNKLHEGPDFEFPINYAQLMVTYFVCMTFSAGMPILYLIGMANFGFTYLVDKYLFINLYRTPNRFSTKIGRMATVSGIFLLFVALCCTLLTQQNLDLPRLSSHTYTLFIPATHTQALVPWAVVVHLLLAIWALSNNSIFKSTLSTEAVMVLGNGGKANGTGTSQGVTNTNIQSKVYHYHTFPLFVLLVVIILLRIVFMGLEQLGTASGAVVNAMFDTGYDTVPKDSVAYQVDYSRAVHRNIIKGLTTYNILHNVKYKELFQISWKFAYDHHHLKSVRLDKPVGDDFDNDAAKVERHRRATGEMFLRL